MCVLSSIPLYGHIQVKMALITHAYFEEGDFTKVNLLFCTIYVECQCYILGYTLSLTTLDFAIFTGSYHHNNIFDVFRATL